MGKFRETLGVNEFKSRNGSIPKALTAEFIGNLLLNFFGCASVVFTPPDLVPVVAPLAFGLTIFVAVQVRNHDFSLLFEIRLNKLYLYKA